MYRISSIESLNQMNLYKTKYEPFRNFILNNDQLIKLSDKYYNIITTQNGPDTDDYAINDNNKVERYTKNLKKGSKILFLGTGTGREILAANDLGFDAYGTTLGSRNYDYGIKYLNIPSDKFFECLNELLPFPNETFDAIHGYQVFEHFISPLLVLLEIGRVLKFNGEIFLEWPPSKNHNMEQNPHHQICYTPGQAKALFLKASFCNIQLLKDNLDLIPESDINIDNQNYFLCIKGTKKSAIDKYVVKAWNK